MCGLAGTVNHPLEPQAIIDRMGHRGPDENGRFQQNNVQLFHLRLAIVDITSAHQPMHYHDRFVIIFNGEIYNYRQLQKDFFLPETISSDTETLLYLYDKLGAKMLDHLDGMFALIIYDRMLHQLFLARDRAGKKPLYYYLKGNVFAFASELNCLSGMVPLTINEKNIFQYLRLGSFYKENTPYNEVFELEAGSHMMLDCKTVKPEMLRWWNIQQYFEKSYSGNFSSCMEKVDEILHVGVKRRIESSDLEVGAFLSGGIDSGLITAIASAYNHSIKTFTVSFDGEYDEAPLAKLVAAKYSTAHHEIRISFDHLQDEVSDILYNYGEPFFDSSAIPSYYVSREAKKHVTVILNGDGADELFAGYRRYVPFAKYDFFSQHELVRKSSSAIKQLLPVSHDRKSTYNYLYRLAALSSKSHLEIYLSAGVDIFEDFTEFILGRGDNYLKQIRDDFDNIVSSDLTGLKKIMNLDFDTNLFSDLLVKMDIATMANSLEGRSPFLCKELLEFAPAIPDRYIVNGRSTKYLLRQLAKKYLPEPLIHQPKRGFEIPLKKWVDGQLREIIADHLSSKGSYSRQFVEGNFIDNLLNNSVKIAAEKRAKILWTLFSLENWYRKKTLHGS